MGKYEHLPSSSVPETHKEFSFGGYMLQGSEINVKHELNKYEIKELSESLKPAIQDIKNDLIRRYETAGVKLTDEDFAHVVVVDRKDQKEIKEKVYKIDDPDMSAASYFPLNHTAVIFYDRTDKPIITLNNIYHELVHSVGRHVVSTVETTEKQYNEIVAVSGFVTGGKGLRGNALEEMAAIALADDYVVHGKSETAKQAREDYMHSVGSESWDPREEVIFVTSSLEAGTLSGTYYDIKRIFFDVCDLAAEKYEREDILKIFLLARVETKEKFHLFNMLKDTLGTELATRIMRVGSKDTDELKSIRNAVQKLRYDESKRNATLTLTPQLPF